MEKSSYLKLPQLIAYIVAQFNTKKTTTGSSLNDGTQFWIILTPIWGGVRSHMSEF